MAAVGCAPTLSHKVFSAFGYEEDGLDGASVHAAVAAPDQGNAASDLLRRLKVHDDRAWHSVVQDHGPRLRRVGFSYRLGAHEVEDALQATWMSLLTHVEQLRDPACLGGWLATIMRHECLRLLCRPGRRRERLVEDWAGYEGDSPAEDDVDALLDRADLTSQMWRLVSKLPPRQRDLIRALFEQDQPSYADVSVRVNMPVGAIGPTRRRALRRLRELIEGMDLVPA
jgi:RNA polymerase sigma factor (sigma-70 family)